MSVSRKTHYALLAVIELARHHGGAPVPNHVIARSQGIPVKFLEAILNELSRAGVIVARRGSLGGYHLPVPPARLPVSAVIQAIEGPVEPMGCTAPTAGRESLTERALMGMWGRVSRAVAEVYDSTTFADLLEEERRLAEVDSALSYAI